MTGRLGGDEGFVAGLEGAAFGLLVCLLTALLAATAWGAVQARIAAGAAAREGTRAFVEARDAAGATSLARQAAIDVLEDRGRDATRAEVEVAASAFERCARVEVVVRYDVSAVQLPLVGGVGQVTVTGRHSELVDPYRDDVPGVAACDG